MQHATDAAVSYAKDAYENSGDTFRDGSQAVAKKVQDNPLGSMLLAGAIGLCVGAIDDAPAAALAITVNVAHIRPIRALIDWPFVDLEIQS